MSDDTPIDTTVYEPAPTPRGQYPPDRFTADLLGTWDDTGERVVWRGVVEVGPDGGYVPVDPFAVVAGAKSYRWQRQPGWVAG